MRGRGRGGHVLVRKRKKARAPVTQKVEQDLPTSTQSKERDKGNYLTPAMAHDPPPPPLPPFPVELLWLLHNTCTTQPHTDTRSTLATTPQRNHTHTETHTHTHTLTHKRTQTWHSLNTYALKWSMLADNNINLSFRTMFKNKK